VLLPLPGMPINTTLLALIRALLRQVTFSDKHHGFL